MKRILITGITGNLGRGAESVFAEVGGWHVEGVSRQTGLDLAAWGAVRQWAEYQDPFDIVLMAHGVQKKVMISEFDQDSWAQVVDGNLKSAAILSMALVKYKLLNPGALVVYCSSIQATQPRAGRGLYAMAKGGLEVLGRAMAIELAPEARAMTLRLGQMQGQMAGIVFSEVERRKIMDRTPLPWVSFEDTTRLVMALYEQPSLSGEVWEISSLHKFNIWPE